MADLQKFVADAIEKLKTFLTREDRSSDYEKTLSNIIENAFKESPRLARDLINQSVDKMQLDQLAVMQMTVRLAKEKGETLPPGIDEKIKQRFEQLRSDIPKGIQLEVTEQKLQKQLQEKVVEQRVELKQERAPSIAIQQEPEDKQMPT